MNSVLVGQNQGTTLREAHACASLLTKILPQGRNQGKKYLTAAIKRWFGWAVQLPSAHSTVSISLAKHQSVVMIIVPTIPEVASGDEAAATLVPSWSPSLVFPPIALPRPVALTRTRRATRRQDGAM